MKAVLKNFSYTLTCNLLSFFISAFVTFVGPKKLGVEQYSYFQLYTFYINYTGFLHFGWADGIFLRYGGEYYEHLNKRRLSGQFYLFCLLELFFSLGIGVLGYRYAPTHEKSIIFLMVGVSIILSLPKTLLQYILQGTNRIKEYAKIVIIEKLIYLGIIAIIFFSNTNDFVFIIFSDLFAKICSLGIAICECKDILLSKPEPIKAILQETALNIGAGIKLMIANFSSILIIGIVQWSIERQWDVVTFGKISLTISISNMLLVLLRAVALIMFPLLRRMETSKLPNIYYKLRICIMIPLLGMLIFYYPLRKILSIWLPQYEDTLIYMAILFPICIFESKMSMLIETYMKALRLEKILMLVNVITVLLDIILTGITVMLWKDLNLTIFVIVILLAFRCVLAEILLAKRIQIFVIKDIILELLLTFSFIAINWYFNQKIGWIVYVMLYLIYLITKKRNIQNILKIRK